MTDPKEMNPQDDEHDWAYKAANQYAASKVDLFELLQGKDPASVETQNILIDAREKYEILFDAFVCGAVFGQGIVVRLTRLARAVKVSPPSESLKT